MSKARQSDLKIGLSRNKTPFEQICDKEGVLFGCITVVRLDQTGSYIILHVIYDSSKTGLGTFFSKGKTLNFSPDTLEKVCKRGELGRCDGRWLGAL